MIILYVDWYAVVGIVIKENLSLRNAIPAGQSAPEDDGNVVTAMVCPVVSISNSCRIDALACSKYMAVYERKLS